MKNGQYFRPFRLYGLALRTKSEALLIQKENV